MAKKKSTKARTSKTSSAKAATPTKKKKAKASAAASTTAKSTTRTRKKVAKVAAKAASADSNEAPRKPKLAQTTQAGPSTKASRPVSRLTSSNGDGSGNGSRSLHEADDRPAPTVAELRKVKSGLTKRDIEKYRKLLLEKRAEIFGDVQAMEGDARNNSGGNLSSMPMHMADIGSDNYEQEFTLGLVESERKLLREIDDALMRIHEGYYGVCMETAQPINRARLDAKPWAKYCIEVARERERLGLM